MKRYIMISTCLLVIFVSAMFASEINGKWKGTFQGPNGDFDIVYTFKVLNDSLTGNVQTQWGTKDFFNGMIDSTGFSFDTEWNGMKLYHHCIMQGDSVLMKMPAIDSGEEIEVTLKKTE